MDPAGKASEEIRRAQGTFPRNTVNMEHLIGLLIAVGLVGYLVLANRFPDKF
jgi:hypothetical protein